MPLTLSFPLAVPTIPQLCSSSRRLTHQHHQKSFNSLLPYTVSSIARPSASCAVSSSNQYSSVPAPGVVAISSTALGYSIVTGQFHCRWPIPNDLRPTPPPPATNSTPHLPAIIHKGSDLAPTAIAFWGIMFNLFFFEIFCSSLFFPLWICWTLEIWYWSHLVVFLLLNLATKALIFEDHSLLFPCSGNFDLWMSLDFYLFFVSQHQDSFLKVL